MPEQTMDIPRLLQLRKLTRAVADHLTKHLQEQLLAIAPLFYPRSVLGDFIRGEVKQSLKGADQVFKELQGLYSAVARSKAFGLQDELKAPLEVYGSVPEVSAAEYSHAARSGEDTKNITITSPLRWVLSYKGLGPRKLKELMASQGGSAKVDLQACVLHYLVMHLVSSRRPGVSTILEALRFPVAAGQSPEFGQLPIVYLSSPISTIRPPDDILIQSTELSGSMAFEEVIQLEDIARMSDPLRDQLLGLVAAHGEKIPLPGAAGS